LVFATVQLLFNAVFFMAANGIALSGDGLSILVKFYFASLVFLGGIYAYFYLINAPMKRNLGISGVDAIALFFSQWFYGERGLEDKLEDLGVEVEVPVAVASFEGKSGKALFVVPYVHFGPFGNLGGSEFCPRLSAALGGKWGNVFVFHGTVTHDFNPVSSDEFEPLLAAVKKAASSLEQKPAKASMAIARKGSAKIQLFSINGCAFASASRAPLTTEDLDFGIGLVLKEKALSSHEIAIVVDEHNAETGDITTVGPASPIANELFGAMDAALAKGGEKLPLHAGFASGSAHLKSIGGNGLRVACFLMGKELHAYLLFDANGIVPDFRDELIAKVKRRAAELGYAAHPEIFTTDTHQVNNVRGVLNPVGKDDRAVLSELSLRLFAEAAGRLEPVKFAAAEERYRTMVFGPTNSIEIISTINSIVAFSKIAAPVMLLAATGLVLWLLTKF
jgi:putative membrane protein